MVNGFAKCTFVLDTAEGVPDKTVSSPSCTMTARWTQKTCNRPCVDEQTGGDVNDSEGRLMCRP